MLPRYHFIFGLIPAILIGFVEPFYGILFLIGAFLIDFDHYIVYAIVFKDLSLSNAIRFFEQRVRVFINKGINAKVFLPFHNVETFLLMLVLSAYIPLLYFLFFGMIFHYVLDLCYDYAVFKRFVREFSVLIYLFRPKRFSIRSIK